LIDQAEKTSAGWPQVTSSPVFNRRDYAAWPSASHNKCNGYQFYFPEDQDIPVENKNGQNYCFSA
jgi:hypothetical protein